MKKILFLAALGLSAAGFAADSAAPAPAPFRPGEKALFFGDSITHNGRYLQLTQLLLDLRGVRGTAMMNSGRSGGSATGGLPRIRHDVIGRGPERVFVLFGMNDVGRHLYPESTPEKMKQRAARLDVYTRDQTKIVELLQQAGIKVVLMTPTAYDQYQPDGKSMHCNEPGLSDCAAIVRKLAKEKNLPVVEFHPYMTEMLKKHPDLHLCGRDLVHPLPVGHLVMASLILEQLGMAGPVAEVRLDAASGKAEAKFARVTDVRTAADPISFRYAPERMVFAIPNWAKDIEKIYPFREKFNGETLTVSGLKPGRYTVSAGKTVLGTFTAAALAKGIDLGQRDTPNFRRSAKAVKLLDQYGNIERTLRTLEMCRGIAARFDAKTDRNDIAAVSATLDKWYANLSPTNPALKYWANVVKTYKDKAPKEAELNREYADLRRAMAEAAVPEAYEITIQKKEK